MTPLAILGLLFAAALGIAIAVFRKYYMPMASYDTTPPDESFIPASVPPVQAPQTPKTAPPSVSTPNPDSYTYPWDSPSHNWHNVRVICDDAGLTLDEKNLICACIYQESRFNNNARCENKNAQGIVTSVDVGIVQVNSYFHTGIGKDFP